MNPERTQPRIICLGEGMIEIAGAAGGDLSLGFGGDVMNTALYLARLGCDVALATALGTDPYSDQLIDMLEKEGVGTELIVRDTERIPGLYLIRTDAEGERNFHYWRKESAARALFQSDELGSYLAELETESDILYFSGITLSLLNPGGLASLADSARRIRRRGGTVVFDSNYRPNGWASPQAAREAVERLAQHVSIALPTFADEAALFGDDAPEAAAARWRSWGVPEVLVKLGAEGAFVLAEGSRGRVAPPELVSPVDTTGAGDSFNAAFLAARLRGTAPDEAAAAGHRLAGAVIRHNGALIPPVAMPE